jgi:hypothetical protein
MPKINDGENNYLPPTPISAFAAAEEGVCVPVYTSNDSLATVSEEDGGLYLTPISVLSRNKEIR